MEVGSTASPSVEPIRCSVRVTDCQPEPFAGYFCLDPGAEIEPGSETIAIGVLVVFKYLFYNQATGTAQANPEIGPCPK